MQMVMLNNGQPPPCLSLRREPQAAYEACAQQLETCAAELRKVARKAVRVRAWALCSLRTSLLDALLGPWLRLRKHSNEQGLGWSSKQQARMQGRFSVLILGCVA